MCIFIHIYIHVYSQSLIYLSFKNNITPSIQFVSPYRFFVLFSLHICPTLFFRPFIFFFFLLFLLSQPFSINTLSVVDHSCVAYNKLFPPDKPFWCEKVVGTQPEYPRQIECCKNIEYCNRNLQPTLQHNPALPSTLQGGFSQHTLKLMILIANLYLEKYIYKIASLFDIFHLSLTIFETYTFT